MGWNIAHWNLSGVVAQFNIICIPFAIYWAFYMIRRFTKDYADWVVVWTSFYSVRMVLVRARQRLFQRVITAPRRNSARQQTKARVWERGRPSPKNFMKEALSMGSPLMLCLSICYLIFRAWLHWNVCHHQMSFEIFHASHWLTEKKEGKSSNRRHETCLKWRYSVTKP